MPQYTRGGQGRTLYSWFSPPTFDVGPWDGS